MSKKVRAMGRGCRMADHMAKVQAESKAKWFAVLAEGVKEKQVGEREL